MTGAEEGHIAAGIGREEYHQPGAAGLQRLGGRRKNMRRERIRGALSFLAVTGFLMGQVAAQEIPASGEAGKKAEILLEGAYIVQEGDTLWAISSRYLENPRLWPKIWNENAFVKNPDLIFPGDPLMIPGVTIPPKPVVEGPAVPPIAEERVAPPISPPVEAPPPAEVAELEKPEEEAKVPMALLSLPISRQAVECSGFVAEDREIHPIGQIVRPVEKHHERIWFADNIFIDLGGRKVQRGDRFWVIRPTKTVKHPATGRSVGIKVMTLGTIEIVSPAGPSPRARVVYNCEDMTTGDFLVKMKDRTAPPTGVSRPADFRVGGYIVGSKSDADTLGQWDIVYVDVGQAKGIMPGDEFSIYQMSGIASHPSTGRAVPLPAMKRGRLVVIRTSAQSAAAVVTRADLNLHVGERIVLLRKTP